LDTSYHRRDEEKIRTIKEWKEPMNVKGIHSFLGFANFYRRFIQDYSQITIPLTRLTRKEVSWEWGGVKGTEQQDAPKQASSIQGKGKEGKMPKRL